jgi:peptide chain release factor subunit 1
MPWPAASPPDRAAGERVLILTPLKDAADGVDGYCERLLRLTYPHLGISLGLLESDSVDGTLAAMQRRLPELQAGFRRARLWQRDFGFRLPPGVPRWEPSIQVERRTVLAKSRIHLLFHALDDEDWVLWIDVDVIEYPPDLIERLLATGREIVQPHCVLDYGGATYDQNGWIDRGRYHLDALRGGHELVELHAVGGTVLLVRADVHRDGLVFPAFLYGRENPRIREGRGEVETEGLGMMAYDMGHRCWGMPNFEVIHRRK